jgi:hypothetical protein
MGEAALIRALEQGSLTGEMEVIEEDLKEVFASHYFHSADNTRPQGGSLHFRERAGISRQAENDAKPLFRFFPWPP